MRPRCMYDGFAAFTRALKQGYQLAKGGCVLARMHYPFITIYGGARAKKDDPYAQLAYELSAQLVKQKIAILTGGGPGIMEAAHRGAESVHKDNTKELWSVGLGVQGIDEDYDPAGDVFISMQSFYIRKWMLTRYSCGFVVFPGGIGTMDELFELLNYNKHKRIDHHPIILFGSNYWSKLVEWYTDAIKQGVISSRYQHLFSVTDSLEEARRVLVEHCKQLKV